MCKKLKQAPYLGIKKVREYLVKQDQVTLYSSQKKAKKQGLQQFKSCNGATANGRTKASCKPAFGIQTEGIYLCPSQLKPFSSEATAQAAGYSAYTACGSQTPTPTPSPTPIVTPKPSSKTFSLDTGTRLPEIDSFSIARLANGTYRAYIAPSISSFEPDTVYRSDSADGLTFGALTAITGINPEAQETFGNPTFIAFDNGSITMVYEEIKHVSSAAVDVHNLMRAVSPDGSAFSNDPTTVVIAGGSLISSYFQPSLVTLGAGAARLYYSPLSGISTVLSADNGATFGEAESVPILGKSDSYAPYPSSPSVVIDQNGTYLMFFTSPLNTETTFQSIFMADSSDGKVFYLFNQPLLAGSSSASYNDPSPVLLPDGTIRIYFIERSGSVPAISRLLKSATLQ